MSRNNLVRALLVLVAAVVPFVGCLPNARVWDDRIVLEQRLAPGQCGGLSDIWTQPYWGAGSGPRYAYRPLALSLIYLERRAFGDAVAPYHAVSLGLHAAVSLLVMALVGRLAGMPVGWMTALFFAVHPVHAEAIALVYGQLELVAAFFILLAIGLYAHALDGGVRPWPLALAVVCALCAYCAKESALMLPALLMLVRAVWMLSDGAGAGDGGVRRFVRGLGWDALFLLAAVVHLCLRYWTLGSLAPEPEATITLGYTPGLRFKTVLVSVAHAVRLCTVPTGQSLYYGHLRDALFGRPYEELMWVVAAGVLLYWLVIELGWRPVLFGAGWFLLALFPVSNVIPTGVLVAERTFYVPSLGVCFLTAVVFDRLVRAALAPGLARAALAALMLLAAAESAVTVAAWRDEETLWRTTVSAHPRSPLAQLLLGQVLVDRWQKSGTPPSPAELDQAATAFDTAYRLDPTLTHALVGAGVVAAWQGNAAKAEHLLRQAIAAAPSSSSRAALQALLAEGAARERALGSGSFPQDMHRAGSVGSK